MRINLNVTYDEKDQAKANGAKWDGTIKKWYIENENLDNLKNMLDDIANSLGKSTETVADNIPKEFLLEDIKSNIHNMLNLNEMKEGVFPTKPEGVKTTNAWLKEGFLPVSIDVIHTYQFSIKDGTGYQYISQEDVRPMTDAEKQAYEEVVKERSKKAAEKAAQTRQAKKEEKDKLNQYKRREVFPLFIKEKGLLEEFDKYYWKYCEEHPEKTESKLVKEPKTEKVVGSKGNNKKIKHLPNYEEIQGKKILCFDTETTGFSPDKGDELLQVAFATLDDGDIKTSFSSLIKPHEKTSWVGAMMKNHISPRMVENAPYPEELREQVQELVNQAEVLVGYNIDFDIDFLSKGMGIDFSGKIIADPSDYFRKNEPESKSFNLESCITRYCTQEDLNVYKSNAHKADTDAIATLKALCSQAKLEGYDLEIDKEEEYEY